MKIAFVSVENNLSAIGFRRMAALVRTVHPELGVYYVVPFEASSPWNRLRARKHRNDSDTETDIAASHLAKADLVCFSSMSTHAGYVRKLIQAIRGRNPNAFTVWGGIHCTVDPDDAVQSADAVCVGEGERAFMEFLKLFSNGQDYTHVGSFYFNHGGKIVRNGLLPLQTGEEMGFRPYPLLGDREFLYKPGQGFVPVEPVDYVRLEGLAYNVVWSVGCPNRCTYCANSKLLKNHPNHGRLRYPPVEYIVGEILHARCRYPHLCSVTFHDDLFMAIPLEVIREFARQWREKVKLPFAVHGLMSRYVDAGKIEALIEAGMFRVRMGIQSGSPRMLKFYRRPDSPEAIEKAIGVIHRFSRRMMTPSYDVIVDNPLESNEDIAATANLLHRLPRPFILNIFPLMSIAGTELAQVAEREKLNLPAINEGHLSGSPASILILALSLLRMPRSWINVALGRLNRPGHGTRRYPRLLQLLIACMIVKRGLAHLRFGNLSVVPNRMAWFFWKCGLVGLANNRMLRRCAWRPRTAVSLLSETGIHGTPMA